MHHERPLGEPAGAAGGARAAPWRALHVCSARVAPRGEGVMGQRLGPPLEGAGDSAEFVSSSSKRAVWRRRFTSTMGVGAPRGNCGEEKVKITNTANPISRTFVVYMVVTDEASSGFGNSSLRKARRRSSRGQPASQQPTSHRGDLQLVDFSAYGLHCFKVFGMLFVNIWNVEWQM